MNLKEIRNVNISINDMCNTNCSYCNYGFRGQNEMSYETIEELLVFIEHFKVPNIHFFGKEPTLSWRKVINICDRLPYEVTKGITTNGKLLGEKPYRFIDDLIDFDFGILISFDGILQQKNRGIKIDTIKTAMNYFYDNDIKAMALCSVTPDQIPVLVDSADLCYKLGFAGVAFNRVVTGLPKFNINWNLYRKNYMEVLKTYGDNEDFTIHLFEQRREKLCNWPESVVKIAKRRNTCGACFGGVGVDWYGDIFGCQRPSHGTGLHIGSLQQGIDMEKVRRIQNVDFPECRTCPIYPCSGCYINNYEANGSITKLNKLSCRFARITREVEIQYLRDRGELNAFCT